MTAQCTHPRAGEVTSRHGIEGTHATAPVCNSLKCITEATEWVERVSGHPAHHVLDRRQ